MVDPVTVAVLGHRLSGIVGEMGEAMLRTAYSQILNSSRDFSAALCDAECRLVAQADHVPIHVGAMPFALEAVVDRFGEAVVAGDVFVLNDPYHGGSHLPDVTILVPAFAGDELHYWTLLRAHVSDIGGATHGAYNPAATEIFHEGLRIPPMRLAEGGRPREDVVDLLALNVRNPRDFRGDLKAMIGAAMLGCERIEATLAEFGADEVRAATAALLDGAEREARAVIAGWTDGVYEGCALLDDDGHGREDIAIRARVTVSGSDVEVDLSGSDPQSTAFVNSSYANMRSAVAMTFAYLFDPTTPKNAGTFRPISVKAREGTIVWAEEGRPVTLCTSHCSNEICEAIVRALAPACPDRAMAGWGRRFRIAIQGTDPRTGRGFIWHLFHARPGGGASPGADGWPAAGEWHAAGGIKFGAMEIAEVRFPLHFRHHEFRPDSGGNGQYRGGTGAELDLVLETAAPARGNTAGDGAKHGSAGILGGGDGAAHHYELHRAGAPPRLLKTKEIGIELLPGDVLVVRSAGGGGWGEPAARDPEAHARDRCLGFVTAGDAS